MQPIVLAPLVCLLASLSPPAPQDAAAAQPVPSLIIHCEVWSVHDAALVGELEVDAEKDPTAADALRARLRAAPDGADRIARFLAPMQTSTEMSFRSSYEVPTVSVNQGQFSNQTSFGGYTSAATTLKVRGNVDQNQILTRLSLEIQSFGKRESDSVPPPRHHASLDVSSVAPSGTMRMFQFDTESGRMLLVFVRSTSL